MNFTGKLEGLKMDYATKKQSISVEVNEVARDAFQELKDCEKLDIQIKKHREKRSLDANAYYWVLITKFAKKLELSNPEAHNMCLIRYGYPVILSGKSACATIPDTEEAENKVKNSTEYHLQPTSQVREGVDGVMYRTYRLLRGSRTYNTEEMSRLISGLITMCKEAQIPDREIATPEEKRLLKERYKEVLGDYIGSLVNFGQMKYNDSEKWKIISEAYIDVKWQSQALKKKQIGEVHSIPYKGAPNSVFDNFKDGALQRRRYYGNDGRPRLDIDMTDHGNSKEHPIVPHYHNWYLDEKGNLKREAKRDNPLKLGHEIANKDILEKR